MTPRERVEAVLRGETPDKMPLTIYECMIPQCSVERELRDRGMCIVYRGVNVFRTHTPNVKHASENIVIDGVGHVQTTIETPGGTVTSISRPAGFTSWHLKKLFSGPDDYNALRALVEDEQYEENYAEYQRMDDFLGPDFILRAGVGLTPLHQIMIMWMGVETFAIEWADRRDEIIALNDLMCEKRREVYPLIGASPASHANYGGNEVPEVMGPRRFREYCVPLYQEAAEALHKGGVLVGSHLDGNNTAWADDVADSGLDYIEAFTPPPDCDLSVADALERWPDKFLWLNFPSSLHLADVVQIEAMTRQLIEESGPGNRVIMGITEDMPPDRWQESMLAIARTIDEMGSRP